ncbi:MAG: GerMN domain-containing protein [Acidobacteria bacterium]|nr:GerMN domain-containing protein [Acidobacteriota bacterium]
MTRRHALQALAAILVLAVGGWAVSRALDRLTGVAPAADSSSATPAAPSAAGVAHITATLYYGSSDGQTLIPVRREVPLADGVLPQGREILGAQLQPAPEGYVSVIPEGTTLRAFYVTDRGDAFVDLSGEAASRHAGGSTAELLTVYAVVHAVTSNLPSVHRVQILLDGREADTLAGHIDLRRPLAPDPSLVREDAQ